MQSEDWWHALKPFHGYDVQCRGLVNGLPTTTYGHFIFPEARATEGDDAAPSGWKIRATDGELHSGYSFEQLGSGAHNAKTSIKFTETSLGLLSQADSARSARRDGPGMASNPPPHRAGALQNSSTEEVWQQRWDAAMETVP